MITRQEFVVIDQEIKDSIQLTFDSLRNDSPENYVLFLADSEYIKDYENTTPKQNPFVIDSRMDRYKDETRLIFLSNFLNVFYSFPSTLLSTDDNEQRIHMELMIYTHIWESKPFLKRLFRLAHISNAEDYNWNVTVPDMTKYEFIRDEIRTVFDKKNNELGKIIKKGFHSSLRNAFAHSEFSFDTMNGNKRIWLDTYKGAKWDIPKISFDDWSKRFVYSALLSYHLLSLTHKNRTNLIFDFGTDKLKIKHPSSTGQTRETNIIYRQEHDAFNFERL
jgi:hypothetical protein